MEVTTYNNKTEREMQVENVKELSDRLKH